MSNADIGVVFSPPFNNIVPLSTSSSTTLTNGSPSASISVTSVDKGRIQGFLAQVVTTAGGASPNGPTTFVLTRNGQTVSTGSADFGALSSLGLPQVGTFFYETLNLLTGSEINKGDKFTLTTTMQAPAGGTTLPIVQTLNLVYAIAE